MAPPFLGDTIAAVASAPGPAAIALVRVSGPKALSVSDRVFRGRRRLRDLDGFRGAHGWVHDAWGPADEVIVWVYRAPRSYTGEDLVEISCHGGPVSVGRVLDALFRGGARPAGPGEFTRRAFLNGRLDLTQAEAVQDLVSARGRRAHELAVAQLRGGLRERIEVVSRKLRDVLVRIEAHLDFGEDVPEPPDAGLLGNVLEGASEDLRRLEEGRKPAERLREGFTVAIAGRPNVGKSSLLNALLGFDRAIVHETPGTTRDVVDACVEWSGIPVRLVDTAGIREAGDPVESEGVDRGRLETTQADVVLWVAEAPTGLQNGDAAIVLGLRDRFHLVMNKADLLNGRRSGLVNELVNDHPPGQVHWVSAKTGQGLVELQGALESELVREVGGSLERESVGITNRRQAHELGRALDATGRARAVLATGAPLELAAADLQQSLDALAAISGGRPSEEVLNAIFERFCIGK